MDRAEFLKTWTGALRSGEYQKTEKAYFREDTGSCCTLGLGAMLITGSLEDEVIVSKGLDQLFELFPELAPHDEKNLWGTLTDKNDNADIEGHVATFPEMADFLEEKIKP